MHAFVDKNITWYSRESGYYNTLVVGVDESTAHSIEQKNLNQISSVTKGSVTSAIGPDINIKEYLLSDKASTELGIVFADDEEGYPIYDIKDRSTILYEIAIHDDCFFSVSPVNEELLFKLIHSILKMHSFYLGNEIDWSNLIEPTIRLIKENKSIQIKSRSVRQCMLIKPARHGIIDFFKDFLSYHFSYNVAIRDGKAYFLNKLKYF